MRAGFDRYSFWAVLLAGFSPLSYKLFTIGAGTLGMALLPFVLATMVGRGARFYLAAAGGWLGPTFEARLFKYLDWIGWICVAAILIGFWLYHRR